MLSPPSHPAPLSQYGGAQDITDEHLMASLKKREAGALAALQDRYGRTLKSLILKVINNEASSEDVLQEVLLEIWDRADSYSEEKGKPLGWMIILARRRAIDRLRSCEAYWRMEERLFAEAEGAGRHFVEHVRENVWLGEVRHHLERVLAAIPGPQRHAIELAYYGGLSQRDRRQT